MSEEENLFHRLEAVREKLFQMTATIREWSVVIATDLEPKYKGTPEQPEAFQVIGSCIEELDDIVEGINVISLSTNVKGLEYFARLFAIRLDNINFTLENLNKNAEKQDPAHPV